MVQVRELVERLGTTSALDKVAEPVAHQVTKIAGQGVLKDLLSGTWLGHPAHPMLTDVPIGAWTSAFLLDLLGGKRARPAADRLVGLGVLAALPTAAAGLSDWSDTYGPDRRIGLVHAGGNTAALACYSLSWLARRRGARARGVALGMLGAAVASASAYLGGHLSFRRGVNVDRNAWEEPTRDWTTVAEAESLKENEPQVVQLDGLNVLVLQRHGRIMAIADRCGHAGGPLHEGKIDDRDCVTCPWHGSVFQLADGKVVHGPATGPQPAFEARTVDGKLELRRMPA